MLRLFTQNQKSKPNNFAKNFQKSYDLDISILRLFSTYGPKNSEYKVESIIIKQLITKNLIKIGNLSPKRDFIYIDDVINAFQIVSENLKGFNIYNVGSEKSYSIQEICNILKKLNGKKIRIITDKTKLRKNDVKNIVSNCSKIKKLGWKSNVSINEGLELTLNWYISKNKTSRKF